MCFGPLPGLKKGSLSSRRPQNQPVAYFLSRTASVDRGGLHRSSETIEGGSLGPALFKRFGHLPGAAEGGRRQVRPVPVWRSAVSRRRVTGD